MEKALTISVASYNIEKYVDNLMESFSTLSKTDLEKIEIIFVNDGSTDGTAKKVEEYIAKYPDTVSIIDKENGGYGSTINASIKVAKGKYFKQLDGDDWYVKENMADFISFLDACDSDIVLAPYYMCYEDGRGDVLSDNFSHITEEMQLADVDLKDTNIYMHELAIKTAVLRDNNISITENCFYTDNEYSFLPLLYAKTVSRFSKPIYCYSLGVEGQSVSVEGIRKHYRDTIKVCTKLCKEYEKNKHRIDDNVRDYLLNVKLKMASFNVYISYMILENPEKEKITLRKYDNYLKQRFPEVYQTCNTTKTKKVYILRRMHFAFYGLYCKMIYKKFTKPATD